MEEYRLFSGKTLCTVFPKLQAEWISLSWRTDAKEIGARSKNPGLFARNGFPPSTTASFSRDSSSDASKAEEVLFF